MIVLQRGLPERLLRFTKKDLPVYQEWFVIDFEPTDLDGETVYG